MLHSNTWWKEMFSGELSVGLNDQKIHQLQDESFLYYAVTNEQLLLDETLEEELA